MSEQTTIGKIDAGSGDRAVRGGPPGFTAGDALVQPSLNRISIHGRVAQVEPKVMQVLVLMAERPGAVIARETFLDTVWAGTVADDYLLNRAVSELRKIFDDDAQAPRYIETIRKAGYRLIAPIAPAKVAAVVAAPATDPSAAGPPEPDAQSAGQAAGSGAFRALRNRPVLYGLAAACVAAAAAAVFLVGSRPAGNASGVAGYDVRPLTSFVGRELEPALSPDGSRVAFIWDGGDGAFDVYVKTIGSEDVLNLTNSDADERHPVWSADGRTLLFARSDGAGISIMRVSALGGGVTRVSGDDAATEIRGMSLSPDGAQVAYARRENATSPYRIVLATLESGERRIVSSPEPGSLGDMDPRFARDGASIVFVRAVNEVTKDLYRLTPDGGEPTRLTFDNHKINGLAWSPHGERLLFTSTRSGTYGLWSMDPNGEDLRPVALGNENVQQPSTATGVDAIAFEQWMHRSQLRQIDLASRTELDAGRFVRSTRWDSNPAWSPDGARIAFASNRSGPYGIWVSDRDGRNAVQIADFDGAFVDNPAWSPDGARIAFDGSPEGKTAIFTVSPEGGAPQRIVDGPGDNRNPAWSRDGAWIYFESNRSGAWRIHAQPAAGGPPVTITAGSGAHPRESADGSRLLYSKPDARGLWQRPREDWRAGAASGSEALLMADLEPRDGANWVPARDGVYFVRRAAEGMPALSLFEHANSSVTDVVALPPSFEGWGLDLSPDETQVIFSELVMRESDLRLAVPRN
ncbi:winged helix-turn-helix domain-containing protein [Luteimonas suaedae]|uniref:winged helix-turn-helix domain-containing protein n=1 Tax=Luteimonas suaedae TaxID=2605430 RepID=UPI0016595BBE|nr:winged helix-turn-helix domain-containing protein [Luteimonas suaedae]